MSSIESLHVNVFAHGAHIGERLEMYARPYIKGFTTNPTLMRRAGITDYCAFARDVVRAIPDRPLSFEVLSDDFHEMERQAHKIHGWGDQVYVKIPVTNTRRQISNNLARAGVKVNVTAVMTLEQVASIVDALSFRV
jgi:transaldolase